MSRYSRPPVRKGRCQQIVSNCVKRQSSWAEDIIEPLLSEDSSDASPIRCVGNYRNAEKPLKRQSSASADPKKVGHVHRKPPPTTTILQSVAKTYEKLLFSDKLSDIQFVCSDGVVLPAHRCILAAASPYFETAFQGPWKENNASGEWKTAHPSSILKAVLSLIYRGDNNESALVDLDALHLLSVASEFQLESLLLVAEDACLAKLEKKEMDVKELLQAAHLLDNSVLKKACFEYIRTHSTELLLDVKITSLATEDPALWAEVGRAICPERNNNKRARLV